LIRVTPICIPPRKVINLGFNHDSGRLVLIIGDWWGWIISRRPRIDVSLPGRLVIIFLSIAILGWRHRHIGCADRGTSHAERNSADEGK